MMTGDRSGINTGTIHSKIISNKFSQNKTNDPGTMRPSNKYKN